MTSVLNSQAAIRLRNLFHIDHPVVFRLVGAVIFLTLFGITMVLSASAVQSGLANNGNYFQETLKQAGGAAIGFALLGFIARFPEFTWRSQANNLIYLGALMQGLVFTPLGLEYGGNRNWLDIGFTTIQPSEFLKLAIILWLAIWISDNEWVITEGRFADWKMPAIYAGGPTVLILLGGDLGTTLIVAIVLMGMLLLAGFNGRLLALVTLVGLVFVAFMMNVSSSRRDRIAAWLQGCSIEDYDGICWQSQHGLWALGTGGIFGLGPGSSHAKWSWLPHAESDYIFAIVGEEMGLLGASFVLLLIAVMAWSFVMLIREYHETFTRLVVTGVFFWLVGQSLVNIAVVLGALPVLGVPLPFVSSGGTSLMANLMAVGLVVSAVRVADVNRTQFARGVPR